MSTKLVENLEKLLNEEKWTRATINNYTIKNFEELDALLTDFKGSEEYASAKEITDEYLKHNKNSIVALYISALIQLDNSEITDNNIYTLIKIFSDNLKWNIVEFLCRKVLGRIEDKFVLKTLISTCNNLNKKEDLPELWERLIKVDYEEADTVVLLANLKEEKGEKEDAIAYYKKAINRYILNKNYVQVEELWKKLLTYEDIGFEYFINLDDKISKNFNTERSIDLMKLLYEKYKVKTDYDICISVLKMILDKMPNEEFSRKEIVNVYRLKYTGHSHLDEYIKVSNLEGSWRNIQDAIDSFEKHIAFDKNNFVYHKTMGIGRIVEVSKDIFTIDFQHKKNHKMSLKMALTSLQILPKNHIWILKLKNLDKLKTKVFEDISWALKTIIMSYNNKATLKVFKSELVPDVMTESKWNTWWSEARKVLKTDPKFGTIEGSNSIFEVREKPLSFEEKTFNSFKASKDFNQRLSLILDYLENTEPDPDFLEEMLSYFVSFLNTLSNVNEQTIISYLLVTDVINKYTFIKQTVSNKFGDFFDELEDPVGTYNKLLTSDFKREYLLNIKKSVKNWEDIYIRIFNLYPNKFIYDELQNRDPQIVEKISKDIITRYKEFPETFFWIITNTLTEDLKNKLNIGMDNIMLSVIHLIEIGTKNINLKNDMINNKRLVKQLKDYLFKDDLLLKHIDGSSLDFSKRLYTILDELASLEGDFIIRIKNKITDKYPEIDTDKALKYDVTKSKASILDRLLTTNESYEKLQKEMLYIKDVEIPNNSKDIGLAMEKGDLRENAEYKAAKELQSFLQNKLNKMVNDLSIAMVIKKEEVNPQTISFGTRIVLDDLINTRTVEYTILGPLESETGKNIISYQSPLGMNLLDRKKDDDVKFILNDKEYHYLVKDIQVADF